MPTTVMPSERTSKYVVPEIYPFLIDLVGKRSAESVVRSPKRDHRFAGIEVGDDLFLLGYWEG